MKAEENRRLEIEILKALSDFTPRNQNNIANAVGKAYEKSTDRVQVHRAVQRIKKYFKRSASPEIEGESNRLKHRDEIGKFWVLKNDLKTIKQVVLDYPELLETFKDNDAVLSMLVDKHVNEICTDEWLSEPHILDFKNRLKGSATFFRLYLLEEPKELRKTLDTLFSITERGLSLERHSRETEKRVGGSLQALGFAKYQASFSDLIDIIFITCVGADILYGRECKAGIKLIKKMKENGVRGERILPLP